MTPPEYKTSESHVLVHGNGERVFGGALVLFLLYVGTWGVRAWLRHPNASPESLLRLIVGIGWMIVCWGAALIWAAEFFGRITWNDQEIIVEAPWRSRRIIRWSDLYQVAYSSGRDSGRLVLSGIGGDLSVWKQIGYEDFLRDIPRLAPADALIMLEKHSSLIPGFNLTRPEGDERSHSRPE